MQGLEGRARAPFLAGQRLGHHVMLLDYLDARPDVDSARIGMTGLSLGGMHTWLAAALDDRVAVAAPMIGVQVPADSACAAAGSNAHCLHCCSRKCSPAAGVVTSVSAFCWALQVLSHVSG